LLPIKNHIAFYSFLVLLIVLNFFTFPIPFFWDMSYISSVAHHIYYQQFSSIVESGNDNGTPPLYSSYFALIWTVFGKQLWISHLAFLPFILGLAYQFYRLSIQFVQKQAAVFALLFLFFDPVFCTQSILMGYDIILIFLYLLAINSLVKKQSWILLLSIVLIPLLNLRGFTLVISIFLIDLYLQKSFRLKDIFKTSLWYLPSMIVFAAWLMLHRSISGWFAVSSGNENIHGVQNILWILKNGAFELQAILDNGHAWIILIGSTLAILLWRLEQPKLEPSFFKILILGLIGILPFGLLFTPMAYPTGPRYFMNLYPFLLLALSLIISKTPKQWHRFSLGFLVMALLFQSNFSVKQYPYSNAWDSSLKVIAYFDHQKVLLDYILENKIESSQIKASFPLHKNFKMLYLNDYYDLKFSDFKKDKAQKGDLIMYSNIFNHLELGSHNPPNLKNKVRFHRNSGLSWISLYELEE